MFMLCACLWSVCGSPTLGSLAVDHVMLHSVCARACVCVGGWVPDCIVCLTALCA
jgi:hypothetical protein